MNTTIAITVYRHPEEPEHDFSTMTILVDRTFCSWPEADFSSSCQESADYGDKKLEQLANNFGVEIEVRDFGSFYTRSVLVSY